jgi:hypothetical protein
MYQANANTIRGLTDVNTPGVQNGLSIWLSHGNLIQDVRLANHQLGVEFWDSNDNRLDNIVSVNHANDAIYVEGSRNTLTRIVAANSGSGIDSGGESLDNRFSDLLLANNVTYGLGLDLMHGSKVTRVTAVNNGGYSILTGQAYTTVFQNVLASNNVDPNFYLYSSRWTTLGQLAIDGSTAIAHLNSQDGMLAGNLLISSATLACDVSGSLNPGMTTGCSGTGPSSVTVRTGLQLSGAFPGKVTVDETANTADSSGTAAHQASLDWFGFEHPLRSWGLNGASFPGSSSRGRCSSGTCRIWDWSLASAGTVVRGTSGDGQSANGAFTAGGACPAAANGSQTITSLAGCSWDTHVTQSACEAAGKQWFPAQTYLKAAVELFDDAVGDDDGLCESNEACLYAPNYGAYQGHGSLASCGFNADGGPVTGVTMVGYTVNGRGQTDFEAPIANLSFLLSSPDDGSVSNDLTPVFTAESASNEGNTVAIYRTAACDGAPIGSSVVLDGGVTIATTGVSGTEGVKTFHYTVTDPFGNASPCTDTGRSYVVDLTPPPDASGFAMSSPSPGAYTADLTPVITGAHAEDGATARIYGDAGCTAPAFGSGAVSGGAFTASNVSVPAVEGPIAFHVQVTDPAGNPGACVATGLSYNRDLTPPQAPSGWQLASTPAGSPSNDRTPDISGSSTDEGAVIRLHLSPTCADAPLGTATVASGAFTTPVTITTDGTSQFYYTITDLGGATSACAMTGLSYTFDGTPPAAPTQWVMSPADGSSGADATPTISGLAAEDTAVVHVYEAAGCLSAPLGSATVTAGTFTIPEFTLGADGAYTFHYTITDTLGNMTACASTGLDYALDRIAPGLLANWSMTSPSAGSVSADYNPIIGANGGEPLTAVTLFLDNDCAGGGITTMYVDEGSVLFDGFFVPWIDGPKHFYYRVTDYAGNGTGCSDTGLGYTLAMTAPPAPTAWAMTSPAPGSRSGDRTPLVTGNAATDGAIVTLYEGAGCATAVGSGVVSGGAFAIGAFTLPSGEGSRSFHYRIGLANGATSECASTGLSYLLDSVAPTSPSITLNSGLATTDTPSALATLSASETFSTPLQMCVGEGASCASCVYQPFAPSRVVSLSAGYGPKLVGAKFRDSAGNESACVVDEIERLPPSLAVLPRYDVAPNWNDYVRAANTALRCDGTEAGVDDCIHGGELRKVVTSETTCAGLAMHDSLFAFDWTCEVEGGLATFTGRLRGDRGLEHLISAGAWAPITARLTGSSVAPLLTSSSDPWWSNPIELLPSSSSVAALTTPSAIYVMTAPASTAGYSIEADKIAVLTSPHTLSGLSVSTSSCSRTTAERASADSRCVIAAGGQKFLWLEGILNAGTGTTKAHFGVRLHDTPFARLHRLVVDNGTVSSTSDAQVYVTATKGVRATGVRARNTMAGGFGTGILLEDLTRSSFSDLSVSSAGLWGLAVLGVEDSIFRRVRAAHNTGTGVLVSYAGSIGSPRTSKRNRFDGVTSQNNNSTGLSVLLGTGHVFDGLTLTNNEQQGLAIQSDHGTYSNVTAANNNSSGIELATNANGGNRLSLAVAANNRFDGIRISGANTLGTTFSNVAAANNGNYGVRITGTSVSKFTGVLALGANASGACANTSAHPGVADVSCANTGESDAVLRSGITLAASFQGKITTDDPLNTSETVGTAAWSTGLNWLDFTSRWRGWGKDGGAFPASTHWGPCLTGTCRAWDWALSASAQVIRGTSGDGATPNAAFVAGGPCPIQASAYAATLGSCSVAGHATQSACLAASGTWTPPQAYLLSASERLADGSGDDDGLCESNETCVYSPNFGAYQGAGELAACSYAANGSAVTGVTMLGYPENATLPSAPLAWTLLNPGQGATSALTSPVLLAKGVDFGSRVDVYLSDACVTSVASGTRSTDDPSLTFTVPVSAVDGPQRFYAKVTSSRGSGSCVDTGLSYTLDTTPPAAPATWAFQGLLNGAVSSNANPVISGTAAENGVLLRLYGDPVCSAILSSSTVVSGQFVFPALSLGPDGPQRFFYTATDAAGNVHGCASTGLAYTLDRTPPPDPHFWGMFSPDAGTVSADTTPVIYGEIEDADGAAVTVHASPSCSDPPLGTGTVESESFLVDGITLSGDGPKLFHARFVDPAGNATACLTAPLTYTLESSAPAAAMGWTLSEPAAFSSSTDDTPILEFTGATPGLRLKVWEYPDCVGGDPLYEGLITTAAGTLPALQLTSGQGMRQFHYTVESTSGASSPCTSTGLSYFLDLLPPTNLAFSVNGGATRTAVRDVVTAQSAFEASGGPVQMCVTESADCSGCVYEPFAATRAFTLSAGLGTKTLSARFLDPAGNATACLSASIDLVAPLSPGPALAVAPDWNQYARASNTALACAGTESGLDACLHGGERRSVPTTEPSCAGLTMTDALGAFDWSCAVQGTAAVFTSTLKTGKGLRDLVNAASWKDNSVTLSGGSGGSSTPGAWWPNSVQALPANPAGPIASLASAGTVYTLASNATSGGYSIDADRVSVVTLPGAELSWYTSGSNNCNDTTGSTSSANVKALLCVGTQNFVWIEGQYKSTSTNVAYGLVGSVIRASRVQLGSFFNANLKLTSSSQVRIEDLSIYGDGAGTVGLDLESVSYNRIARIRQDGESWGIVIDGGGGFNLFEDIVSSNHGNNGFTLQSPNNTLTRIRLFSSSTGLTIACSGASNCIDRNVVTDILAANNGTGISFNQSSGNRLSQVTVANSSSNGIKLHQSHSNVISNVVATNNNVGFYFDALLAGQLNANTTISQLALANNGQASQFLQDAVQRSRYNGALLIGGNTWPCSVGNAGIAYAGLSETCRPTGESTATLIEPVDLSSAFSNKLTSGDAANASDTNGTVAFANTIDWRAFENDMRGWGVDGSTFPTSGNRGRCSSGTCRIWDWSLAAAGSALLETSGAGNAVNSAPFAGGSACPAEAAGNRVLTSQEGCIRDYDDASGDNFLLSQAGCAEIGGIWFPAQTYLRSAVELVNDALGDNDGLCESGEACLYAPNFGAYQGHGTLATCSYDAAGGPITGVTMYGYSTNGRSFSDGLAPAATAAFTMSSPSSGSTSSDTTPAFTGTHSEDGIFIRLFPDSSCLQPVLAQARVASGAFTLPEFTVPVGDGLKTFYYRAVDPSGNASACTTTSRSYTLDTAPPAAPTAWAMTSPDGGSVSADLTPVITGNAPENGSVVSLFETATCSGTALATGTVSGGAFALGAFTASAVSGPKAFHFRIADAGGATTACAATPLSYTVDLDPPGAASSFAMTSPDPGSTTSDATPEISGGAPEDGSTVQLYLTPYCGGSPLATGVVSGSVFTIAPFTVPVDGQITFYARVRDAAGAVTSCVSTGLSYTLDRTPPAAPTWSLALSPAGTNNTSQDPTPAITGTSAENGATYSIFATADCLSPVLGGGTASGGAVTIDSFTHSADGTYTYYFQGTDPLGNTSACAPAGIFYTLDRVAPDALTGWAMSSPANASISADTTPVISANVTELGPNGRIFGTSDCSGAPLDARPLLIDPTVWAGVTVSGDGTKAFYYDVVDDAGNALPCQPTGLAYTLDTIPAPLPTSWAMSSPAPGSTTNDATPQISGQAAEEGSVVSIHLASNCADTAYATGTVSGGSFTIGAFTVPAVPEGPREFHYRIADAGGALSACATTGLSYTLDAVPPLSPSVTINGDAAFTASSAVTLTLAATETFSPPVQMCVAEAADCSTCTYEPFSATRPLTLSAGTGARTVRAKFKDALGNETACVSDSIQLDAFVLAARYAAAPNWNDYVRASDTSTPCDATEQRASDCIHGGERRKVVTGETSCAGLTMTDALGVFDWACAVEGGFAVFTSTLRFGKGLRELVNATSWKSNSVTLERGAQGPLTSSSSTWWTNPVQALVDNTSGSVQSLTAAGTVYTLAASDTSAGHNLNADRISVVTLPGATLTWNATATNNCSSGTGETTSADQRALLCSGGQKFLWIEALVNGATSNIAHADILLRGARFPRIHRVTAAKASSGALILTDVTAPTVTESSSKDTGGAGLRLSGVTGGRFSDLSLASSSADHGVNADGLTSSVFERVSSVNNVGSGVYLATSVFGPVTGNVFTQVTVANNAQAGFLGTGSGNTFALILAANNGSSGFAPNASGFVASGVANRFVQVTAANNYNDGFQLNSSAFANQIHGLVAVNNTTGVNQFTTNLHGNTLSQIVATNNSTGVFIGNWESRNKYTGVLKVGANGTDCSNAGGWPALADGTCANTGESDAARVSGATLASSLLGKVTSEAVNASGAAAGTATYSATLDWTSFAAPTRAWGINGSAFPAADHRGRCSTGTCRIWDWAPLGADSVIRGVSGDGTTANDPFIPGSACPSEVNGTETIVSMGSCSAGTYGDQSSCEAALNTWYPPQTYLKAAVELLLDGAGDEDGLCEAGEACLYTPNFGLFQGRGPLAQCAFAAAGGPVSGVTMWGHTNNGSAPAATPAFQLASPGNGTVSSDSKPLILGTYPDNGAKIDFYTASNCLSGNLGNSIVSGGAFSFAPPALTATNGMQTFTFYYKVTDTYGVGTCASTGLSYTLDQLPPPAPASWAMLSPPNGSLSNNSSPVITGVASENGSSVLVYPDASCAQSPLGAATVASSSFLIPPFTLTQEGIRAFWFRTQDVHGNLSACAPTPLSYTLDLTAPNPGDFLFGMSSPESGSTSTDTTPVLWGYSPENGATLSLHLAADCSDASLGSAVVSGDAFSIPPFSVSGAGLKTFRFRATDAAGNTSACAPAGAAYTLDTTTVIAMPTDWTLSSPDSGTYSSDNSPEIRATGGTPGHTLMLYETPSCDTASLGSFTLTGGPFTFPAFTFDGVVTDGLKQFSYVVKTETNVLSPCTSTSLSYTLDRVAPAGVSIALNGGAPTTASVNVVATLTATETRSPPLQMCVGETADCSSCTYEGFAATKNLTLGGTGTRTVSAKFADAAGNESACVTDSIEVASGLVVVAQSPAAPNWNDYYQTAAPNTACAGSEESAADCTHGGEKRRVATAETSCAGLSMTDALGAFDWSCALEGGYAVFTSSLKAGKGLKDLVNATSWKSNSVTLTGGAGGSSTSTTWWTNTVQALPANPTSTTGPATLASASTIYTLSASANSAGYNINADKIAVVTLSTSILTWYTSAINSCSSSSGETASANIKALVCAGAQKFLWLEGNLNDATANRTYGFHGATVAHSRFNLLSLTNVAFRLSTSTASTVRTLTVTGDTPGLSAVYLAGGGGHRIDRVRQRGEAGTGMELSSSYLNVITDVYVANNGSYGFILGSASSGNLISRLNVVNNANSGLFVDTSSSDNAFDQLLLVGNNAAGLLIGPSQGNRFSRVTAANNNSAGISIGNGVRNAVFSNFLAVNNGTDGLGTSSSVVTDLTVSQLATANNGQYGVRLPAGTLTRGRFTGNLLVGPQGTSPCSVESNTDPGLDGTCAVQGASDATVRLGGDLAASFSSKVTTNDAVNTSDSSGSLTYSATMDWLGFANEFRGWGKDGSSFPYADHRGRCTTGTCRIWDWSLASSAAVVRGTSGDGSTQNGAFVAGAACPAEVAGNVTLTSQPGCSNASYATQESCQSLGLGIWYPAQTYLKAAVELTADGVGDDDGLCESSEACLYAPNFGAYQGHGALGTCVFASDGDAISGVTMYGYASNGQPYSDTVAPTTVTALNLSSPPNGAVSNDTTPLVSGTHAENNAILKLYVGSAANCLGTLVGQATVSGGAYAVPDFTLSGDGAKVFSYTMSDPLGNTSACQNPSRSYTLDLTPPAPPTTFAMSSPASGSTSSDLTPAVTGTAPENGAYVRLFEGAACVPPILGTGLVSGGSYSISAFTLGATEGLRTFSANVLDPAGNLSDCVAATVSYTVDLTPPAAPANWAFDNVTAGTTGNVSPVLVSYDGAETGSTVQFFTDATCTPGPVSVGPGDPGHFIAPVPLAASGTYTIHFKTVDAGGATSACQSTGLTYTYDITPPPLPAWAMVPASGSQSTDPTPALSATGAEDGATYSLYTSSDCLSGFQGSAVASGGAFTIPEFTLGADGLYLFYAKATDTLGNATACSGTGVYYTLDRVTPGAPSTWTMTPASGSTSADTTPEIGGTGSENSATVSLYGTPDCSGAVHGTGVIVSGTFTISAFSVSGDGLKQFYYAIADPAGNTLACAATGLSYTLDTQPPAPPTSWAMSSPDEDSVSTDSTPLISGTAAEEGAVVSVWMNAPTCSGNPVSSGTVTGGAFTIAPFDLGPLEQAIFFTYRITDAAGASTDCAFTPLSYDLDSKPPAMPLLILAGGASETAFRTPELALSATETYSTPLEMCVAEAADCSTCAYEPYATSKAITFSAGYGSKTVSGKFRDARGNETACVSDTVTWSSIVVSPRYPAAPNWNDYVRAASTTTPCDGTETSATACVHGGERRMAVTNETSCTGLTMADSLAAFDWTCAVENGQAVFTGLLKSTKGLGDLVTNVPAWRTNFVTLTGGGGGSTGAATWWGNSVANLPTGALTTLSTAGGIYVRGATGTSPGININADKIAVVVYPGQAFNWNNTSTNNVNSSTGETASANAKALIAAGSQKFVWIEGSFGGGTSNKPTGILLHSTPLSVIRRVTMDAANIGVTLTSSDYNTLSQVTIKASSAQGLLLQTGSDGNRITTLRVSGGTKGVNLQSTSNYNTVEDAIAANTSADGLYIDAASYNRISRFRAFNGATRGMYILSSATGNVIHDSNISNSGVHSLFLQASNNKFVNLTIANSAGSGFSISAVTSPAYNATGNVIHNYLAANSGTGNPGLNINANTGAVAYATVSQLASASNTNVDIALSGVTTGNKFTGNLLVGSSGCTVTSTGASPGLTAACAAAGSSNATVTTGVSLSSSFIGKITTADATNTSDTSGAATYAATLDWFGFDTDRRAWGKDGSAFPNTDHGAHCSTGTCRIWDWSLAAAASIVRGTSGTAGVQNDAFVAGATCPSQAAGTEYLTTLGGETYLKSASELLFDSIGDDDGLCESNEACLYTPNYGAYQGHGSLSSCVFSDGGGAVTGVTMHGYDTNGR